MNMEHIGRFLKNLRKEMTQEKLAEKLGVSSRTVSRWETGANLPDLSVLIELADLYNVDIREIIDGERKSENMEKETKDILMKAADYADQDMKRLKKKMLYMTAGDNLQTGRKNHRFHRCCAHYGVRCVTFAGKLSNNVKGR